MTVASYSDWLLFGVYPYVCLTVLLLGSLVRFDREPYSWKSDSSQILRSRQLRAGSNLFHYGVLVVIAGHFVGFLAPEPIVFLFLNATEHQLLAMVVGGIAGIFAFAGATILVHRRLFDQRVRANSRKWDISIIVMLWVQLALGLMTVMVSARHMDGAMFEQLVAYVKGVVLLRPDNLANMAGVPWVYRLHILLGFTIFLVSPFTRMVHIWSGVGSLAYLVRPHQLVRKRGGSVN